MDHNTSYRAQRAFASLPVIVSWGRTPTRPHTLEEKLKLSRGSRKLFNLLRWYASRFAEVYPLRETLARRLKCSLRSIGLWISELKKTGLVKVFCRGRQAATYEIQQVPMTQLDAEDSCRASAARVPRECPSYPITQWNVRNREYRPYNPPRRKPPEAEQNYILPGQERALAEYLARQKATGYGW